MSSNFGKIIEHIQHVRDQMKADFKHLTKREDIKCLI